MKITQEIIKIIKGAFKEDHVSKDATTLLTIPSKLEVEAILIAKEKGVLCGINIAETVFKLRDDKLIVKKLFLDGAEVHKGQVVMRVLGRARSILTAERVAVNLVSLMSGIATTTYYFVEQVKKTKVKIMDTRKTTPNLRVLEKYAVRVGGGINHRDKLSAGIIIKDNHLKSARLFARGKVNEKKLSEIIKRMRTKTSLPVELEVENLDELKQVLKFNPCQVMLDNFAIADIKRAVIYRNKFYPQIKLEASGGVSLENVRKIAQTNVDYISVGRLTHSRKAFDFSLEIV